MPTITTAASAKLRAEAVSLSRKTAAHQFELARCLYHADTDFVVLQVDGEDVDTLVVESWGYTSAAQWAEHELGLHITTSRSYIKVYRLFGVQLNGMWTMDQLLPITKMIQLIRVLGPGSNQRTVTAWLNRGRTLSCCDLTDAVDRAVHGLPHEGYRSFSSRCTKSDYLVIKSAIDRLAGRRSDDPKTTGYLLARICEDWLERQPAEEGNDAG